MAINNSNPATSGGLTAMTAQITSAYVSANTVPAGALPDVIRTVHAALQGLGTATPAGAAKEALVPAVPIKRSVTPEYIVCLEDGKKLKMLKRHLKTSHNLTPEEYREKWGLPPDYPMTAPNYAKQRSALAHQIGLGKTRALETA